MDIVLYTSFPPTVNSYYVRTRNGVFISSKGRVFRESVIKDVHEQLPNKHIDYRVMCEVILFMPDNRKRDVDNYMKGLLDALQHSDLIADDSLIDQLLIYRGQVVKYGFAKITLSLAGPTIPVSERDANLTGE